MDVTFSYNFLMDFVAFSTLIRISISIERAKSEEKREKRESSEQVGIRAMKYFKPSAIVYAFFVRSRLR